MTFEFIIVCEKTPETSIKEILTELLTGALADKQNNFNEGLLDDMVQIRHQNPVSEVSSEIQDGGGASDNPVLVGFAVELPDDTREPRDVIDNFAKALLETDLIVQTVKFEDPLLRAYLAERASEIFALEMKLRRVLSLVYLNAYQLENPFNLLREERRDNQPQQRPTLEQMNSANENQFFHLLFNQYADLNQRQPPDLPNLLNNIRNSADYESFRAEITRRPIADAEAANFIANLKEIMDPIEQMRNCVAHNRRPPNRVAQNYPNARARLDNELDTYLARWKV